MVFIYGILMMSKAHKSILLSGINFIKKTKSFFQNNYPGKLHMKISEAELINLSQLKTKTLAPILMLFGKFKDNFTPFNLSYVGMFYHCTNSHTVLPTVIWLGGNLISRKRHGLLFFKSEFNLDTPGTASI